MIKFEPYKKWVNEKFSEDDNPIESMGIGMMHEIDKWMQEITALRYSTPPTDIYNKLLFCVRRNKVEFVDYLLPIVQKEYPNKSINDILVNAISYKALDVVKLLIEKYDADIHYSNDKPVYYSLAYVGEFDIFKYFVEKLGLDVMEQNGKWFIQVCAQKNNVDKVKYFVDHGADVRVQNDSALLMAAARGRTRAMRILLKNGAKINDNLQTRLKYWKIS